MEEPDHGAVPYLALAQWWLRSGVSDAFGFLRKHLPTEALMAFAVIISGPLIAFYRSSDPNNHAALWNGFIGSLGVLVVLVILVLAVNIIRAPFKCQAHMSWSARRKIHEAEEAARRYASGAVEWRRRYRELRSRQPTRREIAQRLLSQAAADAENQRSSGRSLWVNKLIYFIVEAFGPGSPCYNGAIRAMLKFLERVRFDEAARPSAHSSLVSAIFDLSAEVTDESLNPSWLPSPLLQWTDWYRTDPSVDRDQLTIPSELKELTDRISRQEPPKPDEALLLFQARCDELVAGITEAKMALARGESVNITDFTHRFVELTGTLAKNARTGVQTGLVSAMQSAGHLFYSQDGGLTYPAPFGALGALDQYIQRVRAEIDESQVELSTSPSTPSAPQPS